MCARHDNAGSGLISCQPVSFLLAPAFMIDIPLLRQLSAEHFVSGEHLAQLADCSRAAISKRIEQLRAAGVLIEARPRVGYRLAHRYAWWVEDSLMQALPAGNALAVRVLPGADSTNDWLRQQLADQPSGVAMMAITDFQLGGKGRRGRSWLSPPGRQMTFSIGISAEQGPLAWIGIALAAGVELAEVLRDAGWPVRLKWPNDILLNGAKLAGILVELDAMAEGPSRVIIGVGLNEALLPDERAGLERPVAALQDAAIAYDREQLLIVMTTRLERLLREFPDAGLARWLPRWASFDDLLGCRVDFQRGSEWLSGDVIGIDAQGSLLLDTPQGRVHCHSGEVSVRKADA